MLDVGQDARCALAQREICFALEVAPQATMALEDGILEALKGAR